MQFARKLEQVGLRAPCEAAAFFLLPRSAAKLGSRADHGPRKAGRKEAGHVVRLKAALRFLCCGAARNMVRLLHGKTSFSAL